MRRISFLLAISTAWLVGSGCAHYQVQALGSDGRGAGGGSGSVTARERTDAVVDCKNTKVFLIDVRNSFGDNLLTALSLGIVPPARSRVEWQCGEPCHNGADAAVTSTEAKATSSVFWGILIGKPLIQCDGGYLANVNVTSNFGQRFLSVVTLGIVSPRTVEWACSKRCKESIPPILGALPSEERPFTCGDRP